MSVHILATLDTKGPEAKLVCELLGRAGIESTLVDTGCLGAPTVQADIRREQVFEAAGRSLEELRAKGDRGEAVTVAAEGAAKLIAARYAMSLVSGVLALGGSAGTTIGTAAMRALPLGVPKVMVSTLASGQVQQFVGDKDILMLNSVVDIAGINRISRAVLTNAAHAMAGTVRFTGDRGGAEDRPLVAATMFGVTTACVEVARQTLEAAGYEVIVFHATGNGGRAMESLIDDGQFAGVLDITTTEISDELVGGFLTAGPNRLTAAGRRGVPQIVSVGATDMVNFYGPDTVPERFRGRQLYQHNANVTLMRTSASECAAIGADIGRKLATAKGPVQVLLPLRGVSAIDRDGQPFNDPVARRTLFDALKNAATNVPVLELDLHINDPHFAITAAERLIELMKTTETKTSRKGAEEQR
jgi:uncharacterized protein (UPF0261 family)